jgi:apolipoprotein D and lipocalin family protein
MKRSRTYICALLGALGAVFGCGTEPPEGLTPVSGFELERYLGKWYEIARLDHRFERGLTNVSAEYSPREGGGITVLNRGYDPAKRKWNEARGRAKFVGDANVGSLKVSFFGPFWGGYHIIALDAEQYGWAMVAGPNRSYLWILSRETTLAPDVLSDLVDKARQWGFATDKLIYVDHSPPQ